MSRSAFTESIVEAAACMIGVIAKMPDETNVIETQMLPIGQKYFGRG